MGYETEFPKAAKLYRQRQLQELEAHNEVLRDRSRHYAAVMDEGIGFPPDAITDVYAELDALRAQLQWRPFQTKYLSSTIYRDMDQLKGKTAYLENKLNEHLLRGKKNDYI